MSYYKSEEEVGQGCKGSVSVSACDINVHSTDNLRLDIVIPGEQHIYVRAGSTPERQQWLVALGTSKSQGDFRARKTSDSKTSPDAVKAKKSELRLYCDLLMQQVHSIKEAATSETGPNIQKLDECTSLLSATCDTFISTLDDVLKISNASSPYTPSPSQPVHIVSNQNSVKSHSNGNKKRDSSDF